MPPQKGAGGLVHGQEVALRVQQRGQIIGGIQQHAQRLLGAAQGDLVAQVQQGLAAGGGQRLQRLNVVLVIAAGFVADGEQPLDGALFADRRSQQVIHGRVPRGHGADAGVGGGIIDQDCLPLLQHQLADAA